MRHYGVEPVKGVLNEQRREPGEDIFLILPILFGEKICYNNSVHDFILRMQEAIWIDWNSCCVI